MKCGEIVRESVQAAKEKEKIKPVKKTPGSDRSARVNRFSLKPAPLFFLHFIFLAFFFSSNPSTNPEKSRPSLLYPISLLCLSTSSSLSLFQHITLAHSKPPKSRTQKPTHSFTSHLPSPHSTYPPVLAFISAIHACHSN